VIDSTFYHEIYASGNRRRDKDPKFVPTFGVPHSMVSTVDHDHHRFRRGLLNEFFSKRAIYSLSPFVQERVQKLLERFEGIHQENRTVDLCRAFASLTSDVITYYCYGKSWSFLEDKDFRSDIRDATEDFAQFSHYHRFFPWLNGLLRAIPPQVMAKLMPGKAALFNFQKDIFHHFSATIQGRTNPLTGDHNIFKTLTDPKLPPKERTLGRIQDEAFTFIIAGTETTMRALSYAVYYTTLDTKVREKLRNELKQVLPTPTSSVPCWELEKLPYLV
jgi:cytochrome P450